MVGLIIWGLTHHGFDMFWAVTHMCIVRWYLLIPIALFSGLTDLVRICAKTVVPATFMYVVGSLSVAIDAVTQTVAKAIAPNVFHNVHGGMLTAVFAIGGGL